MTAMPRSVGAVGWVQVGSDDPEGAKRFYGEMFGWTFMPDPGVPGGGYDLATFPGTDGPSGGITDTRGEAPNHATFFVVVSDVAAAVANAERLGGKVLVPVTGTPTGLVFAELLDPTGNHIGVFTPPAG